ncbi:MAG: polyprenyl diphosphate synthase [Candidatus Marsarchaeota archaeon]|jgi:undecaprenyl diphosphate synthase|nr:polyprenyl diphosphate synthase [Candidatus Marsarchaeota archaeon]
MRREIENIPENVALIPDGNRRWARNHRMTLLSGYGLGIKKAIDFGIWLKKLGVKTFTVWALSTENLNGRNRAELSVLYRLYIKTAHDRNVLGLLAKNGARVKIFGNMELLPQNVSRALRSLESKTKRYKDFTINLLIAYGGREDILHAAKILVYNALREKQRRITEALLRSQLRTAAVPEPDLIIRTSGELRLSGFMPWQSSYSELYFTKKYWPDFSERDLGRAISEFSRRKRRYGR